MTPPGLELHQNWTHRSCGARRPWNIRAISALPRRHSKKKKGGTARFPLFSFHQGSRMGASESQRDGDDDACRCCDDGDGGHATTQGCWTGFLKSGVRPARSIAQRLTAGR